MTGVLTKPLNVGLGGIDSSITVAALAEAGVKRVSTGGSMTSVAFTAILRAARELKENGTATYLQDLVPNAVLWRAFETHAPCPGSAPPAWPRAERPPALRAS